MSRSDLRDTLGHSIASRPVVLDGGLATLLEQHGHDLSSDLWSARLLRDDPDAIEAAHREFFAVGAEVATTASYQVSFEGFGAAGADRDEVERLLRRSVALAVAAREEVAPAGWVAASVGPYGAVLADDPVAEALLAPLRMLEPEMDTFTRVPSATLTRLHMDPEGPTPAVSAGTVLDGLPEEAIEAFLAEVGPGSTTSLLAAELRQLGGALGRSSADAGALSHLDGAYAGFFVAIAATPEMAQQGRIDARSLVGALAPWATGTSVLNFTEERTDTSTAYEKGAWERLRTIRAQVDPDGLFAANHPVPGRRRGPA